jgi:glycosyltransferase involved in cell wall biosynthesis
MHPRIKYLAKKYIPNFIKPYIYGIYRYVYFNGEALLKYPIYIRQIKNFSVLQELIKGETIHILQPSYFDIKGELYLSGGAERYLTDLSKIIKELGYKPIIIQYGSKLWHINHNGIDVIGLPCKHNFILFNYFAHSKYFGTPKVRVYSPFTLAFPQYQKGKSIGISHGIFWDHPHSSALMPTVYRSLKSLSYLVSVDTSTLSWLRGSMQQIADKIKMSYIPNYVDLNLYKPIKKIDSDKIIILFPRRLYAARGFFLVADIIDDILKKYSNVEFHFVGQADEPAKSTVINLVDKFKGKVFFYQQKAEEMYKIYQKADITLIPTVASEGTSLSCIEAMACGNAVIATNVGGLSDLIINSYNGLLIEPNSRSLHDAIVQLIDTPELAKELSSNAIQVAKCFSHERWKKSWKNLIENYI